jgi:hypothetical protein
MVTVELALNRMESDSRHNEFPPEPVTFLQVMGLLDDLNVWITDSGCSAHCMGHGGSFEHSEYFNEAGSVYIQS